MDLIQDLQAQIKRFENEIRGFSNPVLVATNQFKNPLTGTQTVGQNIPNVVSSNRLKLVEANRQLSEAIQTQKEQESKSANVFPMENIEIKNSSQQKPSSDLSKIILIGLGALLLA